MGIDMTTGKLLISIMYSNQFCLSFLFDQSIVAHHSDNLVDTIFARNQYSIEIIISIIETITILFFFCMLS